MDCDHCGKKDINKDGAYYPPTNIGWCAQCIDEDYQLLNDANLHVAGVTFGYCLGYTSTFIHWSTDYNIKKVEAIPKKNSSKSNKAMYCKICNLTNTYAVANQSDGSYICYECRS